MGPQLEVQILDECKEDILRLPSKNLQRLVIQKIVDLKNRELEGAPLYNQGGRDLSDCRKLYVGANPAQRKPPYRIVYRLLPDETNPTILEVIVVGRREGLAAYDTAARRLER